MSRSDEAEALVSPTWVAQLLGEGGGPRVVVVDASVDRMESGYRSGRSVHEHAHLPGAVFGDLVEDLSDPGSGLPFTWPSPERFAAAVGRLGITADDHVIAYDQDSGAWAARLWWLFRAHGHRRVSVLDGGLAAWLRSGGDSESGPRSTPDPVEYPVPVHAIGVVGIDEVAAESTRGESVVVCALRAEQFDEAHIPGSINRPYRDLLNPDGTIDRQAAGRLVDDLDRLGSGGAIAYCGGGINASGLLLALHVAGHRGGLLYDGSLSEWQADPTRPVSSTRQGSPPAP